MSNPISPLPSRWSRALRPGLHVKRWLLLMLAGVVLAGLGLAFLIREWYISITFPAVVSWITLNFLPDWVRGVLLLSLGLLVCVAAVWFLSRSLLDTLLPGGTTAHNRALVNTFLQRQLRRQGPHIVVIGGGTGMPQLLHGLREYTDNLTAVVTVADDGGSSGRLRRAMGMLPPGDFRNNIAALSEAEDLMTRLFQYRFAETDIGAEEDADENANKERSKSEASALAGHSFGNLFIATMTAVTGSFESGIAESSRVLAVRGRVLPSTLEQITLCAEVARTDAQGNEEWVLIEGESKIPAAGGKIKRVFLKPEHARAYPATIQAILQADLIVAAPGSFYTSVMPNLLVPAIRAAICASTAPRIYVCNVCTQPGETDGYDVSEHMAQLAAHVGDAFTTVLANDNFSYPLITDSPFVGEWVPLPSPNHSLPYRLFTGDLADSRRPWRHDASKVAARLMAVYAILRKDSHNDSNN